jgi:ABC-2 type transport system permease protein
VAIGITKEVRASYAFVERNINLVRRYWGWEVVWMVYSVVNALSITYIGAAMERISGAPVNTGYLVLYLAVGTLVWHYLSVVFEAVSSMISWERWEGTIEYTFMAPVRRLTQMVGTCVFSIVYGIVHTLIILAVVALFFRIDLSHANLVGSIAVLLAGSISFIGFGIMASVLPLLFTERGSQMTFVIQSILLLISGVYYPTDVLPGWIQPLGRISPATYVLEGMRKSLLEGATIVDLVPYISVLILIGLICVPAGMLIFSWGEAYAKRTGKLKRSG